MFEPLATAQRAIQTARAGGSLSFDEGEMGDYERDALVEGLPLWFKTKAGNLYLAANVSWPGLFKIGCTRRTVEQRMRQLSGSGVATPWLALQSWRVHDAHGLEARVHKACEAWRFKGELFKADAQHLVAIVDQVVGDDVLRLEKTLRFWLLDGVSAAVDVAFPAQS